MSPYERWRAEESFFMFGAVGHELPFSTQTSKRTQDVMSESVAWLKGDPIRYRALYNGFEAYFEIGDLIPLTVEKYGSGHKFPWSESYYELQSSLQLCLAGYYRHSLFALRSVLELGTLGVFYDLDDKAEENIKAWLRASESTPRFRAILRKLFEVGHFYRFDAGRGFKSRIENCYGRLSNYVHTLGLRHSSSGLAGAHIYINVFRERSIQTYVLMGREVIEAVVTLMLLKYPIGMQALPLDEKYGLDAPVTGGYFDAMKRNVVTNVLDPETARALQEISDSDPSVASTVAWFQALPDITDEQLEAQSKELREQSPGVFGPATDAPEAGGDSESLPTRQSQEGQSDPSADIESERPNRDSLPSSEDVK
jgi:hypothetical protein